MATRRDSGGPVSAVGATTSTSEESPPSTTDTPPLLAPRSTHGPGESTAPPSTSTVTVPVVSTTATPTTASGEVSGQVEMPNIVGLESIEAAAAALSAACGLEASVFPSPAWDPDHPVADGTIIGSIPVAGATLVVGDHGCTDPIGAPVTVLFAARSYCIGQDNLTGLGWCPVKGTTPVHPTYAVPTTRPPDPNFVEGERIMPNVVGAPSIHHATSIIAEACGVEVIVSPSPAFDPANPQPDGTVVASLPAAGELLYATDSGCTALGGTLVTVFAIDREYCDVPEPRIGFGWCPRVTED